MVSLEYLAGFFDGEGYVGVASSSGRKQRLLRVSVTNNNRGILELYHEHFGGQMGAPFLGANGGKVAWEWRACSGEALAFLRAIAPFVILKRPQVDVALTFPLGAVGRYVGTAVQQTRKRIANELVRLKAEARTPLSKTDRRKIRTALKDRPDVLKAAQLYKSGLSTGEVALKTGEKPATIGYWLFCLGVTRERGDAIRAYYKKAPGLAARPEVKRAVRLYQSGLSAMETARRLSKGPATVNYWLRQLKVTRPLSQAQQLRRKAEREA